MEVTSNKKLPAFKNFIRILLWILLWIIVIPFSIILILIIALQFKQTQVFLTGKVTSYLSAKLKTTVKLHEVNVSFPEAIALKELFVADQAGDTLLYFKSLKVDISFMKLLNREIEINAVNLEDATAHLKRNYPDTTFNFDFIPAAFAPVNTRTVSVKADTLPGWKFNLKKIKLHHVYFTYLDGLTGTNARAQVGSLSVSADVFDLAAKNIGVDEISLQNSKVSLFQDVSHQEDSKDSTKFEYRLLVKNTRLKNVKFDYKDTVSGQVVDVYAGRLDLVSDKMNIRDLEFGIKKLELDGSKIIYRLDRIVDKTPKKDSASKTISWKVMAKDIVLKDNSLQYDDDNVPLSERGLDLHHMGITGLGMELTSLDASPSSIAVKLKDLHLQEKSGFRIRQFSTDMVYDQTHIEADLDLRTNNSRIYKKLGISYSSLASLKDSIGNLGITAHLDNTIISGRDVLYFAPWLADDSTLNFTAGRMLKISGNVNGTLNDLFVTHLDLQTGKNTRVTLSGSVKKILEPKNMFLNLGELHIRSSKNDINDLVQAGVIPSNIHIPDSIRVRGNFKGYLKNCDSELEIETSSGNVIAFVKMNPAAGNVVQPYSGRVDIGALELGKILGQPDLGHLNMHGTIKGKGFDSTMNAALDVVIDKIEFKKYAYRKIVIDGNFTNRSFSGKASADDKNLEFEFDGMMNFEKGDPRYVFRLDLKGADLMALHLTEEDTRIKATIVSDIGTDPNHNLSGTAAMRSALMIRNNRKYPIDSLIFNSTYKDGVSDVQLSSEILAASMKGSFNMTELGESVMQHFNSYFDLHPKTAFKRTGPQDLVFSFKLLDPTLLNGNLIPQLEKLTPFEVNGSYNSAGKKLELKAEVPQVKYAGILIDSARVNLNSNPETFKYELGLREISNPTLKTENAILSGEIKNNAISFGFSTARDDSSTLLALGGILKSIPRQYELRLLPDLTFNAGKWQVDPSNYLVMGETGSYANNITLSDNAQSLSVNSTVKKEGAPLEVKFKDFDITTISKVIENNKELVKGKINGNVILEKQNGASAFRSDLVITDFVFQSVPIGTVKLKADNYVDNTRYEVDLDINGFGNNITMKGAYGTASADHSLDFILDVVNLDLKTVEPFTFGQVKRMTGTMKGKLKIGGSVSSPDINGKLDLQYAGFAPKIIDSYLSVPEGSIVFDNRKVKLNNFTLIDTLSNKAIMNGSVDLTELKNPGLDLKIKTNNFLALNTNRKDNPLYYGKIFLDSDIRIKGTLDLPLLDVNAKLNKGSNITYVKPEGQASRNESKGIVEFTDSLNLASDIMNRDNDSLQVKGMKGLELTAAINVDRNVDIKMIVDPIAGDSLYLKGGGLLNLTLDQSGKTGLTGKYTINDGGYYLTISEFVKRSFKIDKGSSVTWTGDPLDAYVDITAVYKIKTSPIDLVQNQMAGLSELEKNKYRNSLNFLVYLKMSGFISAPEISFDIQLSPEDRGAMGGAVNARLAQLKADETQLNKQVFALLTLKRFVGENPLESASDGGFTSAGRSSASKVLTQQLSSLSDRYVNFVDLDVGVNSFEDYSSGREEGRTQLQVGVSKQLFNDKVTVRVGGNIELEGEKAQQNNANDVAGNISIDYKLTEDGRYKLKAFRENQYENPIEGELTKTGAGVVFIRNFNRFKDLLKKPENRRTEDTDEKKKKKK